MERIENKLFAATGLILQVGCLLYMLFFLSTARSQIAPDFQMQLEVKQQGTVFQTQARFLLPLSQCQVWQQLVNHDAAASLPGVIFSKVTQLGPHHVKVERAFKDSILLIPVKLRSVLEIREIPGKGTDFLQIEGDAKSHQGSWRIEPSEAGTWLVYQATTEPDSSLPMAVIRYFLDKRLKNNFLEMAQRITDRGKVDCKAE